MDESCCLFDNSIKFTRPLVDLIIKQSSSLLVESIDAQRLAKKNSLQWKDLLASTQYDDLFAMFPGSLKCSMEVASEPGASSWLSALPILEYGFALHKGDFCDALCLCYGW